MIKEFKEFIARGNVLDLAVGVIIGGAFGKIVSSLVNHIIMPIIGIILGGINFSSLYIRVKDATIYYGAFIQNIIDFIIIAICVFVIVKSVNNLSAFKKEGLKTSKEVKNNLE
ncbi:MAG: large conductance mechanosensitive channel protein MscL [Mollicutes bacterium]|nr:large conductance mechanosensitive channel protein MscL [Mollicutes bacterium]